MLRFEYIDPEEMISSPEFPIIERFIKSTCRTNTGWHYIIDLTWIYQVVKSWPKGIKVLDAGGGNSGALQFLLAEMGFDVTNIDLFLPTSRYSYAMRYGTNLSTSVCYSTTTYLQHLKQASVIRKLKRNIRNILNYWPFNRIESYLYQRRHDCWRKYAKISHPLGRLNWIRGNLCNIGDVPNKYFDAVVSLSALEHIPIEQVHKAIHEIRRVLKPGSRWAVTTSATHEETTWFHKESQGYCFSKDDLHKIFSAEGEGEPRIFLGKYLRNTYLKNHLALSHKLSGKNGMPWGRWNPVYIPVGLTTKQDS